MVAQSICPPHSTHNSQLDVVCTSSSSSSSSIVHWPIVSSSADGTNSFNAWFNSFKGSSTKDSSFLSMYRKLDVTLMPSKWPPSSSDSIDKVSRSSEALLPDRELLEAEVMEARFELCSSGRPSAGVETSREGGTAEGGGGGAP